MRETSDRRSDGVAVEKPERAAAEHSDAATRVRGDFRADDRRSFVNRADLKTFLRCKSSKNAETTPMATMMKTAERALHKRSNKMLASATKRYKKFMRQAAKAASDHKREQYLAAALSALVVTGVVASKLMANLEGKKATARGPARKTRKKKAR